MTTQENRLAEIRKAIEAESVSYGELSELQDLAATHPQLFADDPVLAEAAGIPMEKWRGWHVPARVRLGYCEESAKHTPGPWEISENEAGELDICEEGAGDMLADLAKCKNAQANARLIAAAPDLLQALKNARESLREITNCVQDGWFDAAEDWARANASAIDSSLSEVIAKAEGRAGE